jgi:hypothetical protein
MRQNTDHAISSKLQASTEIRAGTKVTAPHATIGTASKDRSRLPGQMQRQEQNLSIDPASTGQPSEHAS